MIIMSLDSVSQTIAFSLGCEISASTVVQPVKKEHLDRFAVMVFYFIIIVITVTIVIVRQ